MSIVSQLRNLVIDIIQHTYHFYEPEYNGFVTIDKLNELLNGEKIAFQQFPDDLLSDRIIENIIRINTDWTCHYPTYFENDFRIFCREFYLDASILQDPTLIERFQQIVH
jgi:hypothetical protein